MALLKTPSIRRFAATLAATATALALMTAAAVPARAYTRSDDFAKALAALAAIAIVGSALSDRNDDRRDHQVVVPQNPHGKKWSHRRGWDEKERHHQKGYVQRKHRAREIVLPAQCAVEVGGRRYSTVVYPKRCLQRAGIEARLPRQCETYIRSRGRTRTAFDQNCLLNSGFRTQRYGRN
jgi:hypothetical protein